MKKNNSFENKQILYAVSITVFVIILAAFGANYMSFITPAQTVYEAQVNSDINIDYVWEMEWFHPRSHMICMSGEDITGDFPFKSRDIRGDDFVGFDCGEVFQDSGHGWTYSGTYPLHTPSSVGTYEYYIIDYTLYDSGWRYDQYAMVTVNTVSGTPTATYTPTHTPPPGGDTNNDIFIIGGLMAGFMIVLALIYIGVKKR